MSKTPALTAIDALIRRLPASSAYANEAAAALRPVLADASELAGGNLDPATAAAARKRLSETIKTAAIQVNSIAYRARQAESSRPPGRRSSVDLGSADAIESTAQVAIRTARIIAEGAP